MLNEKHRLSLRTNKTERTKELNFIVKYLMASSIKIHAGNGIGINTPFLTAENNQIR